MEFFTLRSPLDMLERSPELLAVELATYIPFVVCFFHARSRGADYLLLFFVTFLGASVVDPVRADRVRHADPHSLLVSLSHSSSFTITYVSKYLSVCLNMHLPAYLSLSFSLFLSIHLSIFLSIYLSVCLSTWAPSTSPFIHPSILQLAPPQFCLISENLRNYWHNHASVLMFDRHVAPWQFPLFCNIAYLGTATVWENLLLREHCGAFVEAIAAGVLSSYTFYIFDQIACKYNIYQWHAQDELYVDRHGECVPAASSMWVIAYGKLIYFARACWHRWVGGSVGECKGIGSLCSGMEVKGGEKRRGEERKIRKVEDKRCPRVEEKKRSMQERSRRLAQLTDPVDVTVTFTVP